MSSTSKPSYTPFPVIGQPTTTGEHGSPSGNYYNAHGENSKSQTASGHFFKPYILTVLPSATTAVTQYTTHFTSAMCMDNTV